MESQSFFFFFLIGSDFIQKSQRKKGNKAQNTLANLRNIETAARRYKESIKYCLAEEGVAP